MGNFGNARCRPHEPPMPDPLAFFLTWTTYGTWLPGDERGWVCKGKGIQTADLVKKNAAKGRMTETACSLDEEQRLLVENTIKAHCAIRKWHLHVVNCRTNHVHVVVSADCKPEDMSNQFKAWCTRKLKGVQRLRNAHPRNKWWTERGSHRYLGDDKSLEAAILYVSEFQ